MRFLCAELPLFELPPRHRIGVQPFGGIPIGKVHLTAGADALMTYGGAEAHDVHCKTCGSLLWSVVRAGEYAHVAYGTLIDAPSRTPSAHIFVGSKAPWHEITDDLPQYDEFG